MLQRAYEAHKTWFMARQDARISMTSRFYVKGTRVVGLFLAAIVIGLISGHVGMQTVEDASVRQHQGMCRCEYQLIELTLTPTLELN
jgi:hypothetical protein